MSSLQCVNCNVRLSRIRRHALSDGSEDLVNNIRLWTYPRDITPADHVCHACWELASQSSGNMQRRRVGHQSVCVVCGRSILRISRRRILIEGANEEEQRVANIVSTWIQPRELRFEDEACVPCWLRARRTRIAPLVEEIQPPAPEHVDGDHLILMCAVCGHSLSTTTSDEEWNPNNIPRLLEHQQMSSMNEVCGVCWEQARVLNLRIQEERQEIPQQNIELLEERQEIPQQNIELLEEQLEIPQLNIELLEERQEIPQQNIELPEEQQERPQYIVLPNIRRAAETARHCIFQECMEPERNVVPEETRQQVLIRYQYYIPRGARICSQHRQEANYENLYAAEYSMNSFSSIQIEEIIFILMERLQNISYENIQNYPDHQVHYFIGITKQEHQSILDATPRLKNIHRGSFALTALLCKLRTGDSGDRLSCLFNVPRRTLETLMSVARNILITDYVPQFLGFAHLRREQVAAKNSYIADHIFGEPDAPADQKPAITIADATYIYTQKSSNYLFQKDTYSLHKYRNLLKPFILCASDGYIIDVRGPYSATTNDATIMNNLLNEQEFNDFYAENDIFILDRGFRDCMDSLHEKGYIGHMPATKDEGQSQLSTLEANKSRCVTINRWVVEAVNGRFKRDFKIFRHEYFNRGCRHLMADFKIAAALLNAFTPPFADNIHAEQFVAIIFERLFINNNIADLVMQHNLHRRAAWFLPIDAANLPFPRLSMEELTLFACGVYQIRQARSYVGEHFRFHGIYTLEVSRERINGLEGINPMLLRAKVKSRHSSAKTYFVFIVAESNMNGRDAIRSYCCNCIVGLRTVGCCSHVMSIIWYLSYARHQGITRPAPFLDEVIERIV